MLCIGAENWPFPVPLVRKGGAWRFDADAGQKEVLFRQVGENELTALAICHEFAAAGKPGRAKVGSAESPDSSAASFAATVSGDSAGRKLGSQEDGRDHTLRIGDAFSGDVEGRPVIDRCSDD